MCRRDVNEDVAIRAVSRMEAEQNSVAIGHCPIVDALHVRDRGMRASFFRSPNNPASGVRIAKLIGEFRHGAAKRKPLVLGFGALADTQGE